MDIKRIFYLGILVVCKIHFASCQSLSSYEDKYEIVYSHTENGILLDILRIYHDEYGIFPEKIEDLIQLYKDGETSFGFDSKIISQYIIDPFSSKPYKYLRINNNSFILYSVGPNGKEDNLSNISKFIEEGGKLSFNENEEENTEGDILIYLYMNGELLRP